CAAPRPGPRVGAGSPARPWRGRARVPQPVFQGAQLLVGQPTGGLLPVSSDERHGGSAIEEIYRSGHLPLRDVELGRDPLVNRGRHELHSARRRLPSAPPDRPLWITLGPVDNGNGRTSGRANVTAMSRIRAVSSTGRSGSRARRNPRGGGLFPWGRGARWVRRRWTVLGWNGRHSLGVRRPGLLLRDGDREHPTEPA